MSTLVFDRTAPAPIDRSRGSQKQPPLSLGPDQVVLETGDGDAFKVERAVAEMSNAVKSILEDSDDRKVPLPNVSTPVLEKVLEYCRYHALRAKGAGADAVKAWDKEFIKVQVEALIELVLAANYMDIKDLLELGCQAIADLIRGKTAEEIRRTFNIANDLSPEEEEEIRNENAWLGPR